MTKINIIDAPCGYGKTSWAIQYMNMMSRDSHKFIYVTPFLGEVDRVRKSVTNRNFYEPETHKGETKLENLHSLLGEGKDICTTHALFQMANEQTKELLRVNNYTLILDEVMNVIEQVQLRKDDLNLLQDSNIIDIVKNEKGLEYIQWNEGKTHYDTKYNGIKQMALTNNLMYCDNSALIWNFPCDFFMYFNNVFILTYLFKGQIQRYYYDLHKINYRYLSVVKENSNYNLIPYSHRKIHDKAELRNLIKVYEGHLNNVGDKRTALSISWFEKQKNKDLIETLRRNAYNFLMNKCSANVNNALWTTVKGTKDKIMKKVKPKSFANSFIPMNTRATNNYKDRYYLAFLINRFLNPIEKKFFEQYGVKIDEETWALSELIQWIWRSRIREGLPIEIYIPSKRMRELFYKYLNSDYFEEAPEIAITSGLSSDWNL